MCPDVRNPAFSRAHALTMLEIDLLLLVLLFGPFLGSQKEPKMGPETDPKRDRKWVPKWDLKRDRKQIPERIPETLTRKRLPGKLNSNSIVELKGELEFKLGRQA